MRILREWLGIMGTLLLAAVLEAGGDALVRYGLREANSPSGRLLGLGLGAIVLFVYGVCVNTPKWDFGRLLGIYIVLFFVISQIMAITVFKEHLKAPAIVGGLLIVAGGLVLTLWKK